MLDIVQDVLLQFKAIEEVLLEDHIFTDCFHCVYCFRVLVLNQKHFTKGTLANDFLDQEILKLNFLLDYISLPCENEGTTLSHCGSGILRNFAVL